VRASLGSSAAFADQVCIACAGARERRFPRRGVPRADRDASPTWVPLVLAPTPLHPAPRLSSELGVPVRLKRDDLAGVGLGGNKLRALEYILADLREHGCDSLVTGAGPQSNWTMLAALACLRFRIEQHVVCYGAATASEGTCGCCGAGVTCGSPATGIGPRGAGRAVAAELRTAGGRPYGNRAAARRRWCTGYVRAS
jgi:D-cysteine desulfhydrase